jgi:hypothetical protein
LEFFWLHYGPGVDSVSNSNKYQEYFLGGFRQPVHRADRLATFMWQNLGASTSHNPEGLSRPLASIALLLPHSVLIRKFAEEETFKPFKHEATTTIKLPHYNPCDKGCVNNIVFR